jgi:phospholipase D1/2
VRRSILAVVVARMIPLFPFTVVNLMARPSRLGSKEYIIGTAIGMSPGLLLLTLFEKGPGHAIRRPGIGSFAILAGVIVIALLIFRYFRIMLNAADKYESKDLTEKNA